MDRLKHAAVAAALSFPLVAMAAGQAAIDTADAVETVTNQFTAVAAIGGAFLVLGILIAVWRKLGGKK